MTPTTAYERQSGDLSRRVARRRAELGLTLEEVGKASGIDPSYLNFLEHNADARLSAGSLILLSMALKTTPEALMNGWAPLRREGGGTGPHPVLEPLSLEQCEVHLANGAFGRLVYAEARGPVAIPVNYEFTRGQIVVSTDETKATWLTGLRIVGFEVDRVDESLSEGWSVMVTGEIRAVDDPEERRALDSLGLSAWQDDGGAHTLLAITPREITGRVIIHPSPWE